MNRYIISTAILAVLVIAAVGVMLFLRSSTPPSGQGGIPPTSFPSDYVSSQQDRQSKEAVQSAFKTEIAPYDNDHTKLYETVIAGDYALQVWKGDNTGGEALLKYDVVQGRWVVLTGGGGAWSVDGLVAAGVPQDTAVTLLAGVPH